MRRVDVVAAMGMVLASLALGVFWFRTSGEIRAAGQLLSTLVIGTCALAMSGYGQKYTGAFRPLARMMFWPMLSITVLMLALSPLDQIARTFSEALRY